MLAAQGPAGDSQGGNAAAVQEGRSVRSAAAVEVEVDRAGRDVAPAGRVGHRRGDGIAGTGSPGDRDRGAGRVARGERQAGKFSLPFGLAGLLVGVPPTKANFVTLPPGKPAVGVEERIELIWVLLLHVDAGEVELDLRAPAPGFTTFPTTAVAPPANTSF